MLHNINSAERRRWERKVVEIGGRNPAKISTSEGTMNYVVIYIKRMRGDGIFMNDSLLS